MNSKTNFQTYLLIDKKKFILCVIHNTSFENFRRRILTYDKGLPRRGWSTTALLKEYKEYLLLDEISQRISRIKVEIIDTCNMNIENFRKVNKEMLIYKFSSSIFFWNIFKSSHDCFL